MKSLFQLTRFYLSLAVALSSIFSYLLIVNTPSFEILSPAISIFLLALGTSALNQIQEVKFDAKMKRTSTRPIVTRKISILNAYLISLSLILVSFILVDTSLGIVGVYFFIFTLITYNLVYTYMKRVSYWALILGSFLGVVSPSIGWIVAQGSFFDIRFLSLFLLYFIWQVPHFWLLMLMNGDDYKKASFPTLKDKIGMRGLMKTISIWYFLVIAIALLLAYSFSVSLYIWIACIVASSYGIQSSCLLMVTEKPNNKFFKIRFMELNTFVFLIMIFLVVHNLGDF